ncbi:hypothetical protein BJ170DRAFT_34887 [Xylariales sp. AK1849]|nr:hypothetical protein BJ170DRAFT_34887 [Xylariales sp. AK1849]
MDDADADLDAMAQAMGFSSFGAQPNKRRKYNPHTDDAVTASSGNGPSIPIHQHKHGKGANAIPLGVRAQNKDEISLDDEDEDDTRAVKLGAKAGNNDGNEDDPEPQYVDTSRPSLPDPTPDPNGYDVQSKNDSIVGTSSGHTTTASSAPLNQQGAPGSRAHHSGRVGYTGVRGARDGGPWYEDYYDPTANMNPWDKLEKERGMEPLSNAWLAWEESKGKWEQIKTQTSETIPT